MFKNYLLLAIRIMGRNKIYSFINVFGLSAGLACCLLLALYIHDEMRYDQEYDRVDDLYRVVTQFHGDTDVNKIATTSPPVAMTMMEEVPEVEAAVRLVNPPGISQQLIKYQENVFYETEGYLGDSTLFDVFSYQFLEGNPKKALVEGNSVVITERLAKKLFGNEPALNKIISIAQGGQPSDYKVTGVMEDITRSHLKPNFIISTTSAGGFAESLRSDRANSEWAGQNYVISYLKLRPGSSVKGTEAKMNAVLMKYGAASIKAMGFKKTLSLEPVKNIYLRSVVDKSPRITYIYVIASIAVLILLLACINFMNLSTAKATKRTAEMGLRKVMGAFRSSLISQILGEAMVTVLISIGISIILVQVALPFFNQLTDKAISFDRNNLFYFGGALASIAVITGLLAGSYPAFYLSSFQPAHVLKSKFNLGNAASALRKSLVVFQFMIAIVLVCGMLVISKQLNFIRQKNLGFETQNMVVIPLRTDEAKKAYPALKNELARISSVKKVSAADYMPGSFVWNDLLLYPEGSSMDKAVYTPLNDIDHNYPDILGIKLIAGRLLRDNRPAEKGNLLINRTAADAYGFTPEQAIGKKLFMDWRGETLRYEVTGVLEDFHQTSLKEVMKPMAFQLYSYSEFDTYENMFLAIDAGNLTSAITDIEGIWEKVVKDAPFEYSFLDENMQKLYAEDQKVSRMISTFTIIAFLICCLGLYGLSSYMAERRTKEIAVRKVMGASVNQIVRLMSKEFIKLVVIATLLAIPLALYCMNEWLNNFAYKTSIDILVFVYAGAIALFIALLTISFESLRAASQNPVDSLRNE